MATKAVASRKSKEPFWLGGAAACMAACFTHPLDQTKCRIQVLSSRVSLLRAVHAFAVRDGIPSLWCGLSASILRQATYSTTRFALYHLLVNHVSSWPKSSRHSSPPSAVTMAACAGLAGGVAGLVGNPAEVILVRMCADGAKPLPDRFAYRHSLNGLIRVAREEGPRALFRGLGPNIVRSVLMNVSQIVTYTEAKRQLIEMQRLELKNDIRTHILASFVAGTFATTVCAPADVLKSRFQNASASESARRVTIMQYIVQTVKTEGVAFLMKGWLPAWLRLAPNTILTFVFMEKLRSVLVNDKHCLEAQFLATFVHNGLRRRCRST